MSTVTAVNLWIPPPPPQKQEPTVQQPSNGVRTSGSSLGGFTFYGVYVDEASRNCGIILKARSNRSQRNSSVFVYNGKGVGGQFPEGADSIWCMVLTDQTDLNNWTIIARTERDGEGGGITFIAGNGGGR
jgi:hypothetical protein